jgi:hypothetical protein
MSTVVRDLPEDRPENIGYDLVGMGSFFIDPSGAARRVHTKWFWVGPLILFSMLAMIASYFIMPLVQHVLETAPIPAGTDPDRYQRALEMGMTFQRIAMYFAPVTTAAIYLIETLALLVMSTILTVDAKFRQIFNLVAGCSLISMLATIAGLIILKAKGEVSTIAELRPALGLDIFLPDGSNKYLVALLGYFSIFEIWWIVMLVLTFSAAFRVSKGKAATIAVPLILLSLCFRLLLALRQPA